MPPMKTSPVDEQTTEKEKHVINRGEDDEMIIEGYVLVRWKQILAWIGIVLTVGFLRLVFYWKPEWFLWSTHKPCTLKNAGRILLRDQYQQWFVEKVVRNKGKQDDIDILSKRYFYNKRIKYVWNIKLQEFIRLIGLEEGHKCSFYHEHPGYTEPQQALRIQLYGLNAIVVRVTPIIKLLFTQALNPFYVFQIFSCTVWYLDQYGTFATTILIISAISLTTEVYVTRSMQRALKRTIDSVDIVNAYRPEKGLYEKLTSDQLVPGDVIEIPRNGCNMLCDAVLVAGNCIVNESMLTGESVPVTKASLPNPKKLGPEHDQDFSMKEHYRHVLFCGTRVVQARFYSNQKVKAVVLRTGFSTAKGELVRSILFPKPKDFKFTQDSYKFIGVLCSIAFIGMAYTFWKMIQRNSPVGEMIIRALDLITICVPPALPAAMTVGVVAAQNRLKKRNIYCITTNNINQSGALNVVCFDKTGTLTEDGLDLNGISRLNPAGNLRHLESDISSLPQDHFLTAMATCHSLTYIEGELSGDPLDLKMFQATGWEFEEPGEEDTSRYETFLLGVVRPKTTTPLTPDLQEIRNETGILRQFTFSSKLQRMSVITCKLGQREFELYAKGAPEMIISLCRPETVPSNFHNDLRQYTKQGYRVIALAWRPLPSINYVKAQRMERQELEKDLDFLGLLVMENRLKPETTPVIQELRCAAIRNIMVTGDNLLTALSVAQECVIISHTDKVQTVQAKLSPDGRKAEIVYCREDLEPPVVIKKENEMEFVLEFPTVENKEPVLAMTGSDWGIIWKHAKDELPQLLRRTAVFARMSPEQKQQLVEELQALGYYVGMCGDGANDCGALKTAHAGISLSEAEASVAAPFTSKEPNIRCVPRLIKEGRAALASSFGIFKYMACYSLAQFTGVCVLYWVGANFTDVGFLYQDLFVVTPLFVTFCFTRAFEVLIPKPPDVSLIAIRPVLSICLQVAIVVLVQVTVWFLTITQPWYEEYDYTTGRSYQVHIVTTIMLTCFYQTIYLAFVLSIGPPYRKRFYTNYWFLVNLIVITSLTVYITMYPLDWIADIMELRLPDSYAFRGILVGIILGNFLISYCVEDFIVESTLFAKSPKKTVDAAVKLAPDTVQNPAQSHSIESTGEEHVKIDLPRVDSWENEPSNMYTRLDLTRTDSLEDNEPSAPSNMLYTKL